jgi:hypothetical protein
MIVIIKYHMHTVILLNCDLFIVSLSVDKHISKSKLNDKLTHFKL